MQNELRKQDVERVLKNYSTEPDHARQVCKIALEIFDKTRSELHNLTANARDLLEAGTLLHDIGYARNSLKHNQHSYDIIMEEQIEGFSPAEKEIIALIARFHRGKKPSKKQELYQKLTDKEIKDLVKKLSAICRIADGLDRTHICGVKTIDCVYDSFSKTLFILIEPSIPDCNLEIFAAERKKRLFEKVFEVTVKFKIK